MIRVIGGKNLVVNIGMGLELYGVLHYLGGRFGMGYPLAEAFVLMMIIE